MLVIEANATGIDGFVGEFGLAYVVSKHNEIFIGEDPSLLEIVASQGLCIEGRAAQRP